METRGCERSGIEADVNLDCARANASQVAALDQTMTSTRHDRPRNLLVAAAGNFVTAILSVGYIAIVGRELGPVVYADFAAALTVSYILIAALHPITTVTLRVASSANALEGRESALGAWRPVVAKAAPAIVILTLFAFATAPVLTNVLDLGDRWVLFLAVAVSLAVAFATTVRALTRAAGEYGIHATASVAEAALRLVAGGALLTLAATATTAMSAYVLGSLLVTTFLLLRMRSARSSAARAEWSDFSGALLLSLGTSLSGGVDVLVARAQLSAEAAGVYGAASTIARAAALVLIPIEIVLIPSLAHAQRELSQTIARLSIAAAVSAGSVLLLFAVFRREIVSLLFGSAYLGAAGLLVVLALNTAFMFGTLLLGQFFFHERRSSLLLIVFVAPIVQAVVLMTGGRSSDAIAALSALVNGVTFLITAVVAAVIVSRRSRAVGIEGTS